MLTRGAVYLLCGSLWFGVPAWAQHSPPTEARALDIVRDDADVLSSEEDRKLTAFLQEVLDQTGVKVLVVVVPTTAPDDGERYGGRLVEHWAKRGAVDPAQTVVAVLAVDDRNLSVLAGRGLPGLQRELTGGGALRFLVPYLKEERYFDALMALGKWLSGRIRNKGDRT